MRSSSQRWRSRPPSRVSVTSCGLPTARASCQNCPATSNAALPPGTTVETGSDAAPPIVFAAFTSFVSVSSVASTRLACRLT